jgi:hypothetical protein
MTGKPRWKHDCDECVFLGTTNYGDVWMHDGPTHITLISRKSDEPSDYESFPLEIAKNIADAHPGDPHWARMVQLWRGNRDG